MRVAINAVVIKEGRILLDRKGRFWILPGGKLEAGESEDECLRREIREEHPGITDFQVGEHYRNFQGKSPHKGDILEARVYFCSGEGDPTQTRDGDSILEARLVSKSELSGYNLSDITTQVVDFLTGDGYL